MILIPILLGIMCAILAGYKGRSAILWLTAGVSLGIPALLVLLGLPRLE